MIAYPASLLLTGGARTGIAPVNLLDVQDSNGNLYYWADRKIIAPNVITGALYDANLLTRYSGPGARLIVPKGAATVDIYWSDWSGNGANYFNGVTRIIFDGNGGATITLTSSPTGNKSHNDYGVNGTRLVGALLGVTGPVAIPGLPDAGEELVVQLFTTDWYTIFTGDHPAATYTTGTASINADNYIHASLTWVTWHVFPDWEQPASALTTYTPWLLSVPQLSFHRSLQTDVGSFILQNLSGDTLSRDFEKIARSSALEGAFFIYRCWQPDAEAAWLEVHGTLSVGQIGVDTVQLKGTALLNPSQDDTPLENYCETCQLDWGGKRCGATGSTECCYSYQTCQVVERIMVVMNNYEKNYGETAANTVQNVINRRRKI